MSPQDIDEILARGGGDEWRVSDLAECIASEWERYDGSNVAQAAPLEGSVYMVSRVDVVTIRGRQIVMLNFPGFGGRNYWAVGFRKVQPKGEDVCIRRSELMDAEVLA